MDPITIHYGDSGPPVTIQQIHPPNTWELNIPDDVTDDLHHILESAEHFVLQNGGDRILINCPPQRTALRHAINGRHLSIVSRTGATYTIKLIGPSQDGLIHEDPEGRVPLQRISCPTCVERIAESRTRARREAYATKANPQQISALTHLIAEAYNHLARIEESLRVPPRSYGDRAA